MSNTEADEVMSLTRSLLEFTNGKSIDVVGVAALQVAAICAIKGGALTMQEAYERLSVVCAGIAAEPPSTAEKPS